jgi:hypothetical protein
MEVEVADGEGEDAQRALVAGLGGRRAIELEGQLELDVVLRAAGAQALDVDVDPGRDRRQRQVLRAA